MAAAKRKRLTEKEVFDQILDSDNDLFSVDDDSDSEDSEEEGYLHDAEIIDSESEVRTNVSGSDFDNDMSGHGSGSNDAPMPMSCDGTSDDESGSDDVPLIRGRLHARRRYNSDQDDDRSWSVTGWARDRFPFTGNLQLKANIHDVANPLEFFELFFDDKIIDLIVIETNRFATQFMREKGGNLKRRSRAHEWTETDANEIRVFFALLLLQGVVYKPELEQYFSKRATLSTPFFRDVMDKDRFILLSKFLHFTDNDAFDPDGPIPRKLYKLWSILQHMKTKFLETYESERDMAVDESLLLWKGRLSWKQYIPSKRARFGIKSFEICESSSGYIWNFFIYTGKDTAYDPDIPESESMGTKVVLTLVKPLYGKGYCFNMDNFFSSPKLYDILCENNTDAVGTLRANRKGVPRALTTQKLRKGEIKALYSGRLMVLKWKDKKDVHMLSTIHDASTKEVGSTNAPKVKPKVCCDYNDTMGGVDLSDAFLSVYPSSRKRLKKYYQKQFRHILDMVVLNAHILYQKSGGVNARLPFILNLVEKLIEKYKEKVQKRKGRPSLGDTTLRLTARHFMTRIPPTPKKEYPKRKCHVCTARGVRKETSHHCVECDKALCIVPCFQIYHTVLNYQTK